MSPEEMVAYTGLLAESFAHVANVLVTEAVAQQAAEEVTPALVGVLECLLHREHCTVRELARALGVSDAAGSQFAHRLEERGLVARQEDAQDRRRSSLTLTAEGRRLASAFEQARQQRWAALLAGMSDDARAALLRGIEAFLLQALEDPRLAEQLCGKCGIPHFPECAVNAALLRIRRKE